MKIQLALAFAVLVTVAYAAKFECPANERMPTYHPDPTDCRYFYQCSNSVAVRMDCGEYLVFNPAVNVCDRVYNVPGCQ